MTTDRPTTDAWTHGWWRDAVVYQIYPRSFADANGDGVGDLRGITERLDHIAGLGADAIWLSPIFRSPMADFGYDVSDYCSVDPVFGTDDDLDDLIAGVHRRGMRIVLDWVPNHSSDQHPWFVASRSSRDDPKRDWYLWRDPAPDGGPPNNWTASIVRQPAWTFDDTTGQYYLHLFLPQQPDLNWANPEVEAAMHGTLRHWLERGVDGFRADVVHAIGKGTELPDLPDHLARHSLINIDEPFTHELLRRIRTELDTWPQRPMMVGEVYLLRDGQTVSYLGDDDELHLTFDFRALHAPWEPAALRSVVSKLQDEFAPPRWPTWVLSNHDKPRVRTLCGSDAAARAAAVLSLAMRGTPFLYAGDEFGLSDAEVPPDRTVDPGGRDGCRAPIPWTAAPGHGWGPEPWLPFPPDVDRHAADAQDTDPDSLLHLYRRLGAIRRGSMALVRGDMELLDAGHDDVLAFRRHVTETTPRDAGVGADERDRIVIVNFAAEERRIDGFEDDGDHVEISSLPGRSGATFTGVLAAHEAVIVVPESVGQH